MSETTTMTIRVPVELKDRLERLATATRRSKSFLAAEAVSEYVQHELDIIEGIERGLADMASGNVVPHDQAMDELDASIEAVIAKTDRAGRA